MTTLLLAAVSGSLRHADIAFTAHLLVAVSFLGELLERRFNNSTGQSEQQVEGRVTSDVIVAERVVVGQLTA